MIYGSVPRIPAADIWIVAGGPSAKALDLSPFPPDLVIAVNQAPPAQRSCPPLCAAVAVCSVDPHWVRRHRDFLAEYSGPKFFAIPLETWPACGGIPGATYLRRSHESGLSDDPGMLATGGNSGYAAINLAYLMGAETIHLLGYDMDGPEDKFRQWIPRFRTMRPQLDRRGVRVFNHNPDSAIDAFELT